MADNRHSHRPATVNEQAPARGADRERAILDAAVALVAEVGYARVTVDAIAARACTSKATMYRRWPSKAALVAEALRRHAVGETVVIADTGTLRGDLCAAVRAITQALTDGDGLTLLGLLEAVREDATLRDLVRTQIDQSSQQVGAAICAHALARGEPVRASHASVVLGVAVACLLVDTLLHGAPPDHAAQQRLVDDVLLTLLRAP